MAKKRHRGRRKANWFSKLNRKQRIAVLTGGGILATLILLAVVALIVVWMIGRTVDKGTDDIGNVYVNSELDDEVGKGYTDIALFGVDSRGGNWKSGVQSDCIIVASLNNKTKEIKLVSVYRDTLLDVTGDNLRKCNSAYNIGGGKQATEMLNRNLDLKIQDYVAVDWAGVIEAIDLLGGVEIEIQEEEVYFINKFMQETADSAGKQVTPIQRAGLQTLNGVQATTYCRVRSTAGSDFTRTERQRRVIEQMLVKASESDLNTILKIVDKVYLKVNQSLGKDKIIEYAKAFAKYKVVGTEGFPMEKATAVISGKGDVVVPMDLTTNVQMLHEFLYGTENYTPSSKVHNISAEISYLYNGRNNTSSGYTNTDPDDDTDTEMVVVPNLVGSTQAQAQEKLAAGNLYGSVSEEYSDTVPAGNVIRQNTAAGTEVQSGATIAYVVSKGPEQVSDMVVVPHMTGEPESSAIATLEGMGFVVSVQKQSDANIPEGSVISVSNAGTSLPKGSTVTIYVSTGQPEEDSSGPSDPDVEQPITPEQPVTPEQSTTPTGPVGE